MQRCVQLKCATVLWYKSSCAGTLKVKISAKVSICTIVCVCGICCDELCDSRLESLKSSVTDKPLGWLSR